MDIESLIAQLSAGSAFCLLPHTMSHSLIVIGSFEDLVRNCKSRKSQKLETFTLLPSYVTTYSLDTATFKFGNVLYR